MSPRFVYTVAALAAAFSLVAVPGDAQDRSGGGRERARERSAQSGNREREPRGARAVPRPAESRQSSAAQQAPQYNEGRRRQSSQAVDRGTQTPSYSAPRTSPGSARASRSDDGRRYSGAQTMSRGSGYGEPLQRAVPRTNGTYQSPAYRAGDRRGYAQPGGGYGRYDTRAYVRPPHFQPYRPFYFSRPYYGFRPHVHLGFGVWLGVSVPYPWAYFGSYRPRVYGYYDRGYYGVAAQGRDYGGLSFDIQPSDADLFVDGEYVGAVGTFTPWGEPLTLWPGTHRIAIVRDGFRTMEWDVTVQPGEVIPYRGMLAQW